ncbi:hypothetical protein GOZ96_04725 [Agrobacterium vitis]|uniref:Uncharacterized protein n=1 Tax=Agrobacterium vitis TaxID=373 RepID=A0A7J4X4E8_AGRVI|nr:hypothetical protein [Agrobacterium vitis]KAA3527048.1 hypothetical protein DXT89_14025 [Agrobacterium vitis]MUZ95893.1 hypothetical protein [Agrobacterium vitis]
MARIRSVAHAFNVGEVDIDNLARIDIDRMRLAAEQQKNIIGTIAGRGFLRPGTGYVGSVSSEVLLKEFVYSSDDSALLEFSDETLRVYVDDALITRQSVSTTITNGDFSSITGWSDVSTSGATATVSANALLLNCSATGATAAVRQQVTVASGDQNVQHALTVYIDRGPVKFMVGSSAGDDDYIAFTSLSMGTHSLAFTPSGNFWVEFQSVSESVKVVDSIEIAVAGVMTIPTPFSTSNLSSLSFDQSGDVIYIAWGGPQYIIERRNAISWSVAKYQVDDGPFLGSRTDDNTKLQPSVTRGNGTLTSSKPFFNSGHVGALFYIFHEGQNIIQSLYSDSVASDPVKIIGIDSDRAFTVTITGTWSGTVMLQRSYDDADYGYIDNRTYTANNSETLNDDYDNTTIWYRFKFTTYTSGVANIQIAYKGGGNYGICRVTGYTDRQHVSIEVLRPFTNTNYSDDWKEGYWSDEQVWPTGVGLAEGRLFWAGQDRWWGSVSDAYKSFDEETDGDSGPLNRSIAVGSVNTVQWVAAVRRLIIGTNGAEVVASSSSLDEPLTPSNSTVRAGSTIGSANIQPAKVDSKIIFVDRSGEALFEMVFGQSYEYQSTEISRLRARLFKIGIKQLAVQRRPETRIWVILNDGSAVCFLYEPSQEVAGFFTIETDGSFESVAVLPEAGNDRVYFVVNRTINGSPIRYVEKLARDSDAKPGDVSFIMDSFTSGTNAEASTTVAVGMHLVGKQVKVWADGAPITETVNTGFGDFTQPKLFTVDSSGEITLDSPVTNWAAGLPYVGRFKSARLAYGAQQGTSLLAKQRVNQLGIMLCDFVRSGVRFGTEFDNPDRPMNPLRKLVNNMETEDISLDAVIDEDQFVMPGDGWTLDRRVCIELQWPASLLALIYDVDSNG